MKSKVNQQSERVVQAGAVLFVLENGRARQHEVEVLARNGSEAWVKTELNPGTPVIVYPPTALKERGRVKKIAS